MSWRPWVLSAHIYEDTNWIKSFSNRIEGLWLTCVIVWKHRHGAVAFSPLASSTDHAWVSQYSSASKSTLNQTRSFRCLRKILTLNVQGLDDAQIYVTFVLFRDTPLERSSLTLLLQSFVQAWRKNYTIIITNKNTINNISVHSSTAHTWYLAFKL